MQGRSEWFKMPSVFFLKSILLLYGKYLIIPFVVFFMMFIIVGIIFDYKYAIVGLMILFIVIPMIISFVYFYFGFSPYCYFNTSEHLIYNLDEKKIYIKLRFLCQDLCNTEDNATSLTNETVDGVKECFRYKDFFIDKGLLKNYIVLKNSVIFKFIKEYNGFLWIPETAFENTEQFKQIILEINHKDADTA